MRKNSVRKNPQNNSLLATSEPQGDKAYAVGKVPHKKKPLQSPVFALFMMILPAPTSGPLCARGQKFRTRSDLETGKM